MNSSEILNWRTDWKEKHPYIFSFHVLIRWPFLFFFIWQLGWKWFNNWLITIAKHANSIHGQKNNYYGLSILILVFWSDNTHIYDFFFFKKKLQYSIPQLIWVKIYFIEYFLTNSIRENEISIFKKRPTRMHKLSWFEMILASFFSHLLIWIK